MAEAQSLFERALAIEENMLGPEHPDTNRSRYHLVRLQLDALDRSEESKALRERYGVASSDEPKSS